jgi:hypothetical protein
MQNIDPGIQRQYLIIEGKTDEMQPVVKKRGGRGSRAVDLTLSVFAD